MQVKSGTGSGYALALAVVATSCVSASRTADTAPKPTEVPSSSTSKVVAAAVLGGIHGSYALWSYFAWYRDSASREFRWTREPWFDVDEYSGGSDKLGHFWANYTVTRASIELLVSAGWPRLQSSLMAAALTEVSWTLTEIQDAYSEYAGSTDDLIANVVGAGAAVAMSNIPELDRLFDFRLQYFPSSQYRKNVRRTFDVDAAQDYSGQSYQFAFHPGGLTSIARQDWGYWSRFVDVVIGYEARGYLPVPDVASTPRHQTFYGGLAVNMQGVLATLFRDSRPRRIGNGVFEVFSLPGTTFRYFEAARSP